MQKSGFLAIALAVGCSGVDADSRLLVSDSTGMTSADPGVASEDRQTGWIVSPEPRLTIGREGQAEYEFHEIAGATRLSDGRLVVGDNGSGTVRIYGADGGHMKTVGRRGRGPGEFTDIHMLDKIISGDTVYVFDRELNRITVLDSQGTFQDVTGFSRPVVSAYRLASGRWLAAEAEGHHGGRVDRSALPGLHRFPAMAFIFNAEGASATSLGPFPGREVAVTNVGGSFGVVPAVYGRTLSFASHNDLIYVGTGEELGFKVYEADGALKQHVRAGGVPQRLTEADASRFYSAVLAHMPADRREVMERTYQAAPLPETMAPYSRLLVDPSGHVWLSGYENPYMTATIWRVFQPAGNYLGVVRVPNGLRVLEVGSDYILGKWQDSLGVEQVRLHELTRK